MKDIDYERKVHFVILINEIRYTIEDGAGDLLCIWSSGFSISFDEMKVEDSDSERTIHLYRKKVLIGSLPIRKKHYGDKPCE